MKILERVITILEIVNEYIPQPFAGNPYKATCSVNYSWTDILIVCRCADTDVVLRTFGVKDWEETDGKLVGGDIITELNELNEK